MNKPKLIHDAPLVKVSQYVGPYDVTLYLITDTLGNNVSLSTTAMKQLAVFMADFQRETVNAEYEKRKLLIHNLNNVS